MNCGKKSTLSWDVTIFTSAFFVYITGFMERNIYDDDTVQAGIKYSDILEKSNVTIFGFENGGR